MHMKAGKQLFFPGLCVGQSGILGSQESRVLIYDIGRISQGVKGEAGAGRGEGVL